MQLSIEGGSLDHRVVGDPAANDTIFGELVQGSHTLLRRTLSSAQETLLEHAGYLAIDDMADADEVAMLRRDILGVLEPRGLAVASLRSDFSGVETPPDGPFVPVLQNPQSHAPGVLRTRFYRNALGIARQLLGFDARLARAHVVVKPPGADARTPWHQTRHTAIRPSSIAN